MKGLFVLVEVITAPSSMMSAGSGAGAERPGGGGSFLPGFPFLFISGAEEMKRWWEAGYTVNEQNHQMHCWCSRWMTHVSWFCCHRINPQHAVEVSGWQAVWLKRNEHILNVLTEAETHRGRRPGQWAAVTKGFPGLGGGLCGGAACLCGGAGLDVLSAKSNIKEPNFREKISFILSGVSMLNCLYPKPYISAVMTQWCYPDKRSLPPLVSVGLSQPADREALHTCHLPRHPANRKYKVWLF